jgi:hypothetical protein
VSDRRSAITKKCSASSKKSPNSNGNASAKTKSRRADGLLHRLIRHAEKIFDLSGLLASVQDQRPQPRTPTAVILKTAVAMFWARLGSLNALESVSAARFWKRWLNHSATSADTMGRVQSTVDAAQLRGGLHKQSCPRILPFARPVARFQRSGSVAKLLCRRPLQETLSIVRLAGIYRAGCGIAEPKQSGRPRRGVTCDHRVYGSNAHCCG